jgi:hypothetical protein
MEHFHIVRQLASKFVYAWDESFEVIAVLDSGYFRDLLDSLSFQTD